MRLSHRSASMLSSLLLLSAVSAMPAHAQLGALRRAVERKVDQKAEDRMQAASLIPPTFDATTIEITAERLDRYTAAMTKLRAERASNRARYDAVDAQRLATADSARAIEDQAPYKAYLAAKDRYQQCRSDAQSALEADRDKRMQEMAARMQRDPIASQRDPKLLELVGAMQAMAAAQESGDTVALRRATERVGVLTGAPIDSASIDKAVTPKCGARPPKPAVVVRHDALDQRADSLRRLLTELMGTTGGVKGSEVGMTVAQARMLWERIQSWLNGMQQNAPITRTFTKAEYDLLVARRDALRKAFSGSE